MPNSKDVSFALLTTFIAGIATSLGALISFCIPLSWTNMLPKALALSAGVMIYISFYEILPHSLEDFEENIDSDVTAHIYSSLTLFSGILIGYIIDFIVHKLGYDDDKFYKNNVSCDDDTEIIPLVSNNNTKLTQNNNMSTFGEPTPAIKESNKKKKSNKGNKGNKPMNNDAKNIMNAIEPTSLTTNFGYELNPIYLRNGESMDNDKRIKNKDDIIVHNSDNFEAFEIEIENESSKLKSISFITTFAIAFHNFPEGIATFFASIADPKLGVSLAFAVGMHNIPGKSVFI